MEKTLVQIKDEVYDHLVKIADYALRKDDQELLPKIQSVVDQIYAMDGNEDEAETRNKLVGILDAVKDLGDLKRLKELGA